MVPIKAYLTPNGLITAEGLKLPEHVGGDLDLDGLPRCSAEGVKLPESLGRHLYLDGLTTAEGLKLPEHVGGYLYLDYAADPFTEWLIKKVDLDIIDAALGKRSDEWMQLKEQVREGDEVWLFCSPSEYWDRLCGREGFALVRQGAIVGSILTSLN